MSAENVGAQWIRPWLFDSALPLWWEVGADPHGGFHEKIDMAGVPVPAPRRLRVQTRQAYAYAEAGRLGWQGPWREAVSHGLDFVLRAYRRPDGFYRTLVSPEGAPLDESVDIYDQAFVLFALAHTYESQGRPAHLLDAATALLEALASTLAHPGGGFDEAVPRRLPLRSNPHMHMLEAMLTWVGFGVDGPFRAKASEIVDLALARLIDPRTGAIGEYYDADWSFAPGADGAVREPGHQFEWAYLLDLAGRLLGRDMGGVPARLYAFGAGHGIDAARKVAVFALDADGAVTDPVARLWAQTERLRTALVLAASPAAGLAGVEAQESLATIARYLDTPVKGLWRDRLGADGRFIEEPAPASSFYHIISAFSVVLKAT